MSVIGIGTPTRPQVDIPTAPPLPLPRVLEMRWGSISHSLMGSLKGNLAAFSQDFFPLYFRSINAVTCLYFSNLIETPIKEKNSVVKRLLLCEYS